MKDKKHVITRNNVEQEVLKSVRSDVVIHNKLGNGDTCKGLLRRFVHKNTNKNEISPHNDMVNKNGKELIHLSTYRLIDFKNVKNLFPYFPISFSLKQLRRFRIKSGMTFIKQPAFTLAEGATHVDLPPTKVKFAFTLAEVLITLGIIGIVAAMTIPNLIADYQKKQTVTKLQKAISILNQAYKLSFDDVGEPNAQESFDMGAETYFKTYWAPYIKTSLICTSYKQCGYKDAAPWYLLNNNKLNVGVVLNNRRTTFYTPDGFLYVIFTAAGPQENILPNYQVYVDINGGQGPNKLGRDLFILERVQTDGGGIQPYGRNFSDYVINKNCSKGYNGDACAEKIRRSGWKIEKDYPWN